MHGPELARQIGITYRQLDFWCSKGYLGEQHIGDGAGRGRYFNATSRAKAKKIADLVKAGLKANDASAIVFGDKAKYEQLRTALEQARMP